MLSQLVNSLRKLKNLKKQRYIKELEADGLKLGKNVSIVDDFFFDRAHCYLISIGDNTTIAPSVKLIAHDASTKRYLGFSKFGQINIGKDCFIGHSSIVMPNVTIGDRSIIGSGSVVTKDIPPNSVAAGNPAKVICDIDEYLEKIKAQQAGQKVYGYDYHIHQLDAQKRDELLNASKNSMGFII